MQNNHNTMPPNMAAPLSADDHIAAIRLMRSPRVGAATYQKLIAKHGSPKAALQALPQIAREKGVENYQTYSLERAAKEYWTGYKMGARLLHIHQAQYPPELAKIADAPPIIWVLGKASVLMRPMVALVGARNASSLGIRMAKKIAHDLGDAGVIVVSGLARGIDTAVHMGSLHSGTVAVQAGGIDVIYPPENTKLARDITKTGVRICEHPIGMRPQARHFPRRNRLISGLSSAVVVMEAAAKSGTLITAKDALDQGRDVMAVPGHPFDARCFGCNSLIRDGATLVRSADDVLEHINHTPYPSPQPKQEQMQFAEPAPPPLQTRSLRQVASLHQLILSRLGPSPTAEDQLIRDLKHPSALISPALTELEIEGKIERQPGGLVSRI